MKQKNTNFIRSSVQVSKIIHAIIVVTKEEGIKDVF